MTDGKEKTKRNRSRKDIFLNSVMAALGLMVFGFGVYLTIQANIGVAPWDALNIGLSQTFGILYGTASISVSFLIIAVDLILKEKIGIGTVLDAIVVGKTVDLMNWADVVDKIENNIILSLVVMVVGLFIMGLGQIVYMKAALCCGPRDSLMLAINKRLTRLPVGAVSIMMMAVVLIFGWQLGGPIGLGTIICTVGIGSFMQLAFNIFRFEPKDIVHQGAVESIKVILGKKE